MRSLIIVLCLAPLLAISQPAYKFRRMDVNDGLSHNQTTCIHQDSRGFMWFGTMSGLNRYDGYSFKVFRRIHKDTTSLNDNYIVNIFEDHLRNLWVETRQGNTIYLREQEHFIRNTAAYLKKAGFPESGLMEGVKDPNGNFWYLSASRNLYKYTASTGDYQKVDIDRNLQYTGIFVDMATDSRGNLWLIFDNGSLLKIPADPQSGEGQFYAFEEAPGHNVDYAIFVDSQDHLWVYAAGSNHGVYWFDPGPATFQHIGRNTAPYRLNTDLVNSLTEDNQGRIWIGTDHGGINILDRNSQSVSYVVHHEEDESSLSHNNIISLYRDRSGIIWAGAFKKGINYYHKNLIKFHWYKKRLADNSGLPYNDANCFAEDEKGNIWIGTNGGGLIYFDRGKNTFHQYRHDPANPNSLSSDIIVSLFIDQDRRLWIGTYFGGLNYFDGKKFHQYRHDPANPKSLGDDRIWEIYEDSDRNLWIGTLGGGLDLFDREKQVFYHYKFGEINSIHSNHIFALVEDRDNDLWIGTAYGIDVLDKASGRFIHMLHNENDESSLSNDNVFSILEDSRGWIWVGTREGLNRYDKNENRFRIFRKEDGLPDNTIIALLEDQHNNLWISTPNGLSNLKITSENDGFDFTFKNYDVTDGLQGREFNDNAALKTSRGEMIFGGANGFNLFKPDEISFNKNIPEVVLTDLQIFNHSMRPGKKLNGRTPLTRSITETGHITLKQRENMFSIEFAALNFLHPQKNRYEYKLEGFNEEWLSTDGQLRKAVYTNLDPGDYTFRVRASNNDGVWNEEGAALSITVLPPFWRSKAAFALYAVLVIGALALARRLMLERERSRFRMEQERTESNRRHLLDLMKIRFFTNISHEFRTPLSLIIAPVEGFLQNTKDEEKLKQYRLIHRNARRLLNLVNQLLDFRKMEVRELKLNAKKGDIVRFVKDISWSFSDISEKKNISFSFHSSVSELLMAFDHDKVERILFNLLSNAFKFTPEQGEVLTELDFVEKDSTQWVRIQVKDTGIGIPRSHRVKIFERFFQDDLPASMINQGNGIGLSITREFVRLHGGKIEVESEQGNGSCFIVWLPVSESLVSELAFAPLDEKILAPAGETVADKSANHRMPAILLVEDNEDLRFYLKDNLKAYYQIVEAENGKEAWRKLKQQHIDLVVSDIIMSEMDGLELCKKIKENPKTSRIPVILLSAKSSEDQKLSGYEAGADDYITKPFNFEILLYRIKILIAKVSGPAEDSLIEVAPSRIAVTSVDEKLIKKSVKLVEQNIDNADFSVEELSRELGMSRVSLYKKLRALTGKSPIEFIRIIRLKRAAQLLEESQLSVSEIAYQVGFNNPKYFTRYFKAEFKMLPSRYQAEKQKQGLST